MIGPEGYKLPVAVAPFEIDVTEVTVAAYDKCLRAKRCDVVQEDDPDSPPGEPPPPNSFARAECNEGNAERLQHPMNCISGPQAAAYCAWIKKRLPTDAEWELAATGPDGRILPWGAIDPAKKPCWDQPNTCPVASHPDDMSPVGVFDMAGNVDEWAVDYRTKRPGTRASEVPSYAALGANWRDVSDDTTIQEYNPSDTLQRDTLGFRCAR